MIPQNVPLYAVGTHTEGVDLFLVTGWMPVGGEIPTVPLLVMLDSTDARFTTLAELYHNIDDAEPGLAFHDALTYHVDRDEARRDYAEAVATFNARPAAGSQQ